MASQALIEDQEAILSATFRSVFDVYSSKSAQIDIDAVNYSRSAVQRRVNLQHYWSVFDGITNMVTVHTKVTEDGEAGTSEMRSVRVRPSQDPTSLCNVLANLDNALLGYVTNHVIKLGFYMRNFPPPFITADVVFVPASETTKCSELVTICISDQSIEVVRPTDSSCFSYPNLQESQNIIKRGEVSKIGAGTVFAFVKVKEEMIEIPLEEPAPEPPKMEIMSDSGEVFSLDRKLALMIQHTSQTIPAHLLSMARVFGYNKKSHLGFEDYAKEMDRVDVKHLMHNIVLGVFSGVFKPKQTAELCLALGSFINGRCEQQKEGSEPNNLSMIKTAKILGFTKI